MNGICILVHQANFSEGGFAKLVPLPTPFFFLFVLFYFFCSGLGDFYILLYVSDILGGGRRNPMVALKHFISSTLTL